MVPVRRNAPLQLVKDHCTRFAKYIPGEEALVLPPCVTLTAFEFVIKFILRGSTIRDSNRAFYLRNPLALEEFCMATAYMGVDAGLEQGMKLLNELHHGDMSTASIIHIGQYIPVVNPLAKRVASFVLKLVGREQEAWEDYFAPVGMDLTGRQRFTSNLLALTMPRK